MTTAISHITNLLRENIQAIGETKAYVFGSASRLNSVPKDIDILIIYDNPLQPQFIRKLLIEIDYIPIHLIFLMEEEEYETNFIKKQNCISII